MIARVLSISLGFVLVCTLTFGGYVHDAVHHEHGHGPDESVVWQQLHSAVRHEHKKSFLLSKPLILELQADVVTNTHVKRPQVDTLYPGDDPVRGTALRKAKVKHRAFR
ncbi:MAG: hypothetical protein RIQ56_494 [Candidatus Parcubacteria bacterium]|jgi:hypothetical protein